MRQVVGGMALNIHPLAVKDVKEIGQRYLAISEELYDRFWEELDSALEMIDSHPEHHHFDRSGKRRSNLKKVSVSPSVRRTRRNQEKTGHPPSQASSKLRNSPEVAGKNLFFNFPEFGSSHGRVTPPTAYRPPIQSFSGSCNN